MLYGIRAVTTAAVRFTWVDTDFLASHQVQPWSHMPAWFPQREGMEGFGSINCDRAIGRGLTFRPLADTAADTLAWFATLPEERRTSLRAGLPADRERDVLTAWHAAQR